MLEGISTKLTFFSFAAPSGIVIAAVTPVANSLNPFTGSIPGILNTLFILFSNFLILLGNTISVGFNFGNSDGRNIAFGLGTMGIIGRVEPKLNLQKLYYLVELRNLRKV